MKNYILPFLKVFLPFNVILFLVQYYISEYVFEQTYWYYSTLAVYSFLFVSTILIYFIIVWVYQNFPDKAGFAFMACSLLKMLTAVGFLLPLLLANVTEPFLNILFFFIPYFLFLIFETVFAVRLLNEK